MCGATSSTRASTRQRLYQIVETTFHGQRKKGNLGQHDHVLEPRHDIGLKIDAAAMHQ